MAKMPAPVVGAKVLGQRMLREHRAANPEGRMPLMDHIRELRRRLIIAVLALLAGMGIGLIPQVFNRAWHFIERPFCAAVIHGHTGCHQVGDSLVINGIFDPFTLRIQVAFYVGLIISSPIWLYQFWAFIAPGLYSREKRWAYLFVGAAVPLFLIGAVLAYLAMGRGLHFLLGLTPNGVLNLPTISTYLGYFTAMLLVFARVLTHERFRKWRRFMIFGVFLFAGVATPSPDPITMLLLALPCVLLVEVAELIIWANDRRLARRPSPYAGLSDDEVSPLDLDDSMDGSSQE